MQWKAQALQERGREAAKSVFPNVEDNSLQYEVIWIVIKLDRGETYSKRPYWLFKPL